jgi:hypothetical protein
MQAQRPWLPRNDRAKLRTNTALLEDNTMNEDRLNMSLRKFLQQVGVTSQREIERVVREKPLAGKLKVKMTLTAPGTSLNHVIEEELDLG